MKHEVEIIYKRLKLPNGDTELRCEIYIDKELKLSCSNNDLDIQAEAPDGAIYTDLVPEYQLKEIL